MSFWSKLTDDILGFDPGGGGIYGVARDVLGDKIADDILGLDPSGKGIVPVTNVVGPLALGAWGASAAGAGNLLSSAYNKVASLFGGGAAGAAATGADAVAAYNAGAISAAEFEALATGAGTTSASWLSGKNLMAALPYAASAIGGITSANAATQAANTQAAAANRAAELQRQTAQEQLALQKRMYEESVSRQQPWLSAGQNALAKLSAASDYTPFGMQQFRADPGYGFRMSEGLKALDRQAAARGGLISGGALKAAERYGQGLASDEYQNAFNRYQAERQARLGPLQSLAGVGQTTAQQLGSAGQTYASQAGNIATGAASNIGNLYTDIGSARSAGQLGRASAYTNAFNTGLNFYGQQQQNQLLIDLLKNRQPIGD